MIDPSSTVPAVPVTLLSKKNTRPASRAMVFTIPRSTRFTIVIAQQYNY
jgi:hypothetical protein